MREWLQLLRITLMDFELRPSSKTQLLTLYFLDSGDYVGKLNWLGFFTPSEYDWIRQSQIDWFLQESGKNFLEMR